MDQTQNTDINQMILQIVMAFARIVESTIRRQHADLLPPHYFLLGMLCHHPFSQHQISRQLKISPSTVSATIDILSRKNLVTRERSSQDRRVVLVSITPEGEKLTQDMQASVYDQLDAILINLTNEERTAVQNGLGSLLHVLYGGYAGNDAYQYIESPFRCMAERQA